MSKGHLIYDVIREHKDTECVISSQRSDLFDNVGKLIISDKSEECHIFNITIDNLKSEISCIEYINSDENLIREDVAESVYRYLSSEQKDKYHKLCKKIVESAYLCMN